MKYAINALKVPDPTGPYSQGTTAGRHVFLSGQVALDPQNPARLLNADIKGQVERIIDIFEELLAQVDCNLTDVAKTTIYLINLDQLCEVEEVFEHRFARPAPARSVVEVSRLPYNALVEIDCIACR